MCFLKVSGIYLEINYTCMEIDWWRSKIRSYKDEWSIHQWMEKVHDCLIMHKMLVGATDIDQIHKKCNCTVRLLATALSNDIVGMRCCC